MTISKGMMIRPVKCQCCYCKHQAKFREDTCRQARFITPGNPLTKIKTPGDLEWYNQNKTNQHGSVPETTKGL